MSYIKLPVLHGLRIAAKDFRVLPWGKAKKTCRIKDYFAFPFFWARLPLGNCVADGKILSNYGAIPTISVAGGAARYTQDLSWANGATQAVSGIPLIVAGRKQTFTSAHMLAPWFDSSPFYATTHIIMGLRQGDGDIYVYQFDSKCSGRDGSFNELASIAEGLGLYNAMLGDGGGSSVMDVGGKNVSATRENRVLPVLCGF